MDKIIKPEIMYKIFKFSKSLGENYDYTPIKEIKNPDKFDSEKYEADACNGFTVCKINKDGSILDYFSGDTILKTSFK